MIPIKHLAECNLQKLQEEQEDLSRRVKEQNLSPQEVERMAIEHENLQRTVFELRRKAVETQQAYHNLEVTLANRTADIEKSMDEYMQLVWHLELHPQPPPLVSHVNFELSLDIAKDDPKKLIIGNDLRSTIVQALVELAKDRRKQRSEAEDEAIQVDYSMDTIAAECENLEEDISNIDVRTTVLSEQADVLRKVSLLRCCIPSVILVAGSSRRCIYE